MISGLSNGSPSTSAEANTARNLQDVRAADDAHDDALSSGWLSC
jgi:hypothetical protein